MPKTLTSSLAVALVVLAGSAAEAQQTIARAYSVRPHDGMSAQFEAALKEHVAWRVANGDPWTWSVSTLEVGNEMGEYSIRSGGHSWADLDAYDADFAQKGLTHWNATVAPLVQSVSSTISVANEEWSHRPPQGRQLAFVNITTFHIRPGEEARFNELVGQATSALKASDMDAYWVFASPISGGGMGPVMNVIGLHDSWADMEPQDEAFQAAMAAELGGQGLMEWMNSFGQVIRGTETTVRRIRPDLGSNAN